MSGLLSSLLSSETQSPRLFYRVNTGSANTSAIAPASGEADTQATATQTLQAVTPSAPSGDTSSLGGKLSDDTLRSLFAALDADGNGGISQEEFVNARPDYVSEDQAVARFSEVDTDGDGSINMQELANGAPPPVTDATGDSTAGGPPAGGPPPGGGPGGPPPGGGPVASDDEDEEYDDLDTNEDGVVSMEEFLADSDTASVAVTDDEDDGVASSLKPNVQRPFLVQFMNATQAYNVSQYGERYAESSVAIAA